MIQYEAEQNVPFPIDEVVWDYQLIEDLGDGELNAMIVAAKTENVVQFTDCVMAVDLEPEVVDVAPMAIYNSVRYNYPELEECTMVLDIGTRSSSLIFIEGSRIFSRSIPVAGNTITQELMKEFDVSFEEAEALKEEHAFVAFGGVYAGPENETADWVSKIVRNVMTRLHAEVNRSINFYRSQQGGSPPSMALLTGCSSVIPHTDTFFREKLGVDVEYFNPFVNISVSPDVDIEVLEGQLHMLGEVSGLALRYSLACPVEINLLPPEIVAARGAWIVLRKK
jgi:type IV pilus assembly protein PilM